jgi:hypothetical protein
MSLPSFRTAIVPALSVPPRVVNYYLTAISESLSARLILPLYTLIRPSER